MGSAEITIILVFADGGRQEVRVTNHGGDSPVASIEVDGVQLAGLPCKLNVVLPTDKGDDNIDNVAGWAEHWYNIW